jgi:hypothetical protein
LIDNEKSILTSPINDENRDIDIDNDDGKPHQLEVGVKDEYEGGVIDKSDNENKLVFSPRSDSNLCNEFSIKTDEFSMDDEDISISNDKIIDVEVNIDNDPNDDTNNDDENNDDSNDNTNNDIDNNNEDDNQSYSSTMSVENKSILMGILGRAAIPIPEYLSGSVSTDNERTKIKDKEIKIPLADDDDSILTSSIIDAKIDNADNKKKEQKKNKKNNRKKNK